MSRDDIRYCVEPGQLPGSKFRVGQLVRDRNTLAVVRVTAIDPANPRTGRPRLGFAWENTTTKRGDKDHSGFCPEQSAGCFEAVAILRPWRERLADHAPTLARLLGYRKPPGAPAPGWEAEEDSEYDEERRISDAARSAYGTGWPPTWSSDEIIRRLDENPLSRGLPLRASTAEQLAAMCAGAAMGILRSEGKTFIETEDLARDALALARDILRQGQPPNTLKENAEESDYTCGLCGSHDPDHPCPCR